MESEIAEVMEMYAQGGLTSFNTTHIYGSGKGILCTFLEQWAKEKEYNDVFHDVQVCCLVNSISVDLCYIT